MPLLVLARLLTGLLSLLIVGAGGYLVWSWWRGEDVIGLGGELVRSREDWRLWTGLALLGFSLLGRFLILPLIARPDRGPRFERDRPTPLMIQGAGGPLATYADGPRGDPNVVITHGWGLDSSIWSALRPVLAKRRRVISWDLPGMGKSKGRLASISLESFADDLALAIERADHGRLVLVGHSIGGMTIQTLARKRPDLIGERVAGIVLINTTYMNPLRTMWLSGLARALRWPVLEPMLRLTTLTGPIAQLLAWQSYLSGAAHLANRIGFGKGVTRSQLEATTFLATRNRQDIQAAGNLAMFRWNEGGETPDLGAPTLVLAGGVDLVTKREASDAIVSGSPGATLLAIPDANHMGFLEQHEAYASAIEGFITRLGGRASPIDARL